MTGGDEIRLYMFECGVIRVPLRNMNMGEGGGGEMVTNPTPSRQRLSVLIQVFTFRVWHTRVFKMAPIHHHFELGGWPETTVIVRFWVLGGLFVLVTLVLPNGILGLWQQLGFYRAKTAPVAEESRP